MKDGKWASSMCVGIQSVPDTHRKPFIAVLLIDREPPMLSVHEHVVERQVQ